MAPKKAKEVDSPNSWRTIIEEALLDEETWKVKVMIIEAAGSEQDRLYLNKFEIFAKQEKRFVIKNICKSETMFMINQLGGDKKVKDESLRVFEEGQSYLKDKKDIPPDIQALIIKYLILKMKEEYLFIKKQRLEVKEGMRRESITMIDRTEVRGTVNIKPPEPVEPPLPPTKNKGKKDDPDLGIPEPDEGKKYNTTLRVRGEEWRDKVYVDDFPTDGPNLYVAVTGFTEPNLASNLVQIGIPLRAIIQVRIDPTITKVPSSLSRATKRGQSQTEILTEKSYKYWEDLQLLRIHKNSADDFKHTAFVVFSPPYWNFETLTGSPDKIYDELSFLMYDIQDLSRQHLHYLENMDIIHIPENIAEESYERYYHQQIDDLPLECVTIYSVLDSILQTVCNHEQVHDKSSKYSLSTSTTWNSPPENATGDAKTDKAVTLVQGVFKTLLKTETNKKVYRLTYGEEYEDHMDPTIINYGDIAKYSTFHLGNINLNKIIWSSLLGMPLHKLWNKQNRPQGEFETKIHFHRNVLLSCFQREDVEIAELNRMMHILACRKLYNNRSSLKKTHIPSTTISDFKKIYLKRSVLAEPLGRIASVVQSFSSTAPSFPSMMRIENMSNTSYGDNLEASRIKFLFDCPDISELVSAVEISNQTPASHMIDDFEHFEDFSGISAFQILFDAFNKFNCVDYKYCEVTDTFVLMFFNSHDTSGIACEEWRCHLATPLCLQDFFDFVLEQHYDWVQNEEKIYDEAMRDKSQSECKVIIDPNAQKSCVGDMEVDMDLLMEGSLKFQDIAEKMEDETSREATNTQAIPSKKTTTSPVLTDIDSKSSRKPKSPPTTTPKSRKQSFMASTASELTIEIPPKPFLGYDLGDRRVEVFGKDATFFSRDGTRVYTMYTLIIPMNIEYIIMNVVPGNSYNEFWIHKAMGDTATPEMNDSCESFRITSKDQVMINIKKQTYEIPLPISTTSSTETQALFSTKVYHSFFVTWPNGLITESIHKNNSPMISHIKQYNISPILNLEEYKRCITLNGEVLIFKTSGEIEVLRPDGSYINIIRYMKKLVVPDVPDEISIISSDKSKKSNVKEKAKDKPSKTASKSKYLQSDNDTEEQKPLEYEFVIEEFECIETSGLKQRWVNDVPFTLENLLTKTATDYCMNEVFSKRMGGTHILLNKDGYLVTFPNKTRIITKYIIEDEEVFPEWTDEEIDYFDMFDSNTIEMETIKSNKSRGSFSQSYTVSNASAATSFSKKVEIKELNKDDEQSKQMLRTDGYVSIHAIYVIEHANFATITVNKATGEISVESPNSTAVTVDSQNSYKITLDSVTQAFLNGENLTIKYEACPECQAYTTCDINIGHDKLSSGTRINQNWLTMKDSFGKRIAVNEEGIISIIEDEIPEEITHLPEEVIPGDESRETIVEQQTDLKSEISVISHGKCREMYLAKTIRFFVLHRELTCSELVHRSLLDLYKRDCRWQPWCSINQYDTFGDHRSLLSLLTPVHLTETEKWLMDSQYADKPKYLTYKDLKKDCGKGFYHWMRPYERFQSNPMKQENVLPPRLPRAFILRILEQQWKECDRDAYKGAQELIRAILRYRRVMESDCETLLHDPIVDPRPEDERRIHDIIQALGHRIYEDLKIRLSEDVMSRAKPDITTKPPPVVHDMSVEGEIEEELPDELRALEEDRNIKKVEDAEPLSPSLAKYWRRRAEEYKEEQFYKHLLREGNVPPYFQDVLGGAVWWDLTNTADEAVTKVERRRMKCVCTDPEKTERPKMNCVCSDEESQNDITLSYM